MMYVLRYSLDIEADLKRGWTPWVCENTMEELLYYFPHEDLDEEWEKWQDPDHAPWHHRDHSSRDDFIQDYAETNGWDIRYDESSGEWCGVLYEGLPCLPLESEEEKEAIAEGEVLAASEPDTSGWLTDGDVRLVKSFGNWHILGCEDVWIEL